MGEIQKLIRQGLQIKQTVLVDAFPGLAKMGDSIWKALEREKRVLFLGEGLAHTLAEFTAHQLQIIGTSKKPKVQSLSIPALMSDRELESFVPSAVESHLDEGDLLVVFSIHGQQNYLLKAIQKAKSKSAQTLIISGQNHKIPKDWINFGLAIPTPRTEDILELHLMIGNIFCTVIQAHLGQLTPSASSTGIATAVPSPTAMPKPAGDADEFIRFACEKCGEVIFTERRFSGKKGTCPGCNSKLIVPGVSTVSPDQMKGTEKRIHLRFKVQDCLVGYSKKGFPETVSEFTAHAILEDLSEGGCAFLIETTKSGISPMIDFKSGEHLFLLISIPAFNQPLRIKGEVRRIQPLKGKRAINVGIKFIGLTGDIQEKLTKLQSSDILRNLRRASGLF